MRCEFNREDDRGLESRCSTTIVDGWETVTDAAWLRRRDQIRRCRSLNNLLERPLAWPRLFDLLPHRMQVVGNRDNGKKQKQQAAKCDR